MQTLVDGDKMKIRYGAQDLSPYDRGAYTGDISGPMLAKLGCSYVLCGHSERRQYHHEDDALVNAKVRPRSRFRSRRSCAWGSRRRCDTAGEQVTHVMAQLGGSLAKVPAEAVAAMVIAYEPIWAIGTGEVASPGDAQEMSAAIREWVSATAWGRNGRRSAYPVWRIREGRQHRAYYGATGRRRSPRRRR